MPHKNHVNVALIGQGFMGRTHSNAWGQVRRFFKPPLIPVMHTVFGQEAENPRVFADHWGWKNASTDWHALVQSPQIDLVDVVTPNYMHAAVAKARRDISVGVGKAGKIGLLRQILDGRAGLGEAAAAVGFNLFCGDLQERGFARAVAPDNAKPRALLHEKLRAVQQRRGADGETDVLKRQKRRGHVCPGFRAA